MHKNGKYPAAAASDSKEAWKKIFSPIAVSPAFRPIRRATHFPQEPAAASAARSRYPPQPQTKKSAESVPVVIRIPITSTETVGKACDYQANSKVAAKIEPEKPPTHHVLVHKSKQEFAKATHSKVEDRHDAQAQAGNIEGKKQGGLDINDAFSEFINLARIKAKSPKKMAESDDCRTRKESKTSKAAKLGDGAEVWAVSPAAETESSLPKVARRKKNKFLSPFRELASIEDCIEILEAMEDLDDAAYVRACERFTSSDWRRMFMKMSDAKKRMWLYSLK